MSSKTARSGPKVTRVAAGTAVFREGDLGTEMFVVRSGAIEIRKRGPAGGEQRIAVLEKGDPFGEMVVLDDVSYGVSAVATADSELVRLNRAMFDRLLRGNPEIAVRIMRKLTARIRALEAQLAGESEGAGAAPVVPSADSKCAFVTVDGARVPFSIGVSTVVGREDPVTGLTPGVDLSAIDPERSSSRQHARLFTEEGRFFLTEDIGTTNGTFVNDEQLKPGVAVEIVPGDQLRFGLVAVRFVCE